MYYLYISEFESDRKKKHKKDCNKNNHNYTYGLFMIHVHTRYNKISSCIALSKPSSQRKLALITHHSMNFFAR